MSDDRTKQQADKAAAEKTAVEKHKPSQQPAQRPQDPSQTAQDEQLEAVRKADAAIIQTAPQYVQDAAARMGGDVPRAAPKGGEGSRTSGMPIDDAYPAELAPTPAPTEYRAAPPHPSEISSERPKWGGRPSIKAVEEAETIEARTVDPRSAPIFVGGARITNTGASVELSEVRARSAQHLRALATDPRIELKLGE